MIVRRSQLSKQQLETLIRIESRDSSKVFFTKHALEQMRARHITAATVLSTLQNGRLKRTPEPNLMKGSLECKMEHPCAGKNIGVIVALSDENPGLIIVTAMYV